MSKKNVLLVLLVLAMVFLVAGCEDVPKVYTNEIKGGWVDIDMEWEDSTDPDESHLSYVPGSSGNHLDIGWNTIPSDSNSWIMGYIEEYTYSEGALIGKYTSHQNPDLSEHDITITFSYTTPTLTAVVVAGGVLGNKTLSLTATP